MRKIAHDLHLKLEESRINKEGFQSANCRCKCTSFCTTNLGQVAQWRVGIDDGMEVCIAQLRHQIDLEVCHFSAYSTLKMWAENKKVRFSMVSTVFFSALNIGSLVKNSAWRRQNLQKVQTAKLQGVQLESI